MSVVLSSGRWRVSGCRGKRFLRHEQSERYVAPRHEDTASDKKMIDTQSVRCPAMGKLCEERYGLAPTDGSGFAAFSPSFVRRSPGSELFVPTILLAYRRHRFVLRHISGGYSNEVSSSGTLGFKTTEGQKGVVQPNHANWCDPTGGSFFLLPFPGARGGGMIESKTQKNET